MKIYEDIWREKVWSRHYNNDTSIFIWEQKGYDCIVLLSLIDSMFTECDIPHSWNKLGRHIGCIPTVIKDTLSLFSNFGEKPKVSSWRNAGRQFVWILTYICSSFYHDWNSAVQSLITFEKSHLKNCWLPAWIWSTAACVSGEWVVVRLCCLSLSRARNSSVI